MFFTPVFSDFVRITEHESVFSGHQMPRVRTLGSNQEELRVNLGYERYPWRRTHSGLQLHKRIVTSLQVLGMISFQYPKVNSSFRDAPIVQ